ncbi:MAG: chemotaxis protein CheW [Myxococcota bacterium]
MENTDGLTQYCTFHLGGLFLGISVDSVQEVIRYQEMTRVPLAAETVRGLINLRGQIVTAIDLRTRFGLPPRDELPMNVVVRTDDDAISFLVDEIGDVLEVADDRVEPPPATLTGVTRELVRKVCKLDGRLLLILDTALAAHASGEVHAAA